MTKITITKVDRELWATFWMRYEIEMASRQKRWDEDRNLMGARTFSKAIGQLMMDSWKITYTRRQRWIQLGWLTAEPSGGFGTLYTPATPSAKEFIKTLHGEQT